MENKTCCIRIHRQFLSSRLAGLMKFNFKACHWSTCIRWEGVYLCYVLLLAIKKWKLIDYTSPYLEQSPSSILASSYNKRLSLSFFVPALSILFFLINQTQFLLHNVTILISISCAHMGIILHCLHGRGSFFVCL
jgi:hypothetical protein